MFAQEGIHRNAVDALPELLRRAGRAIAGQGQQQVLGRNGQLVVVATTSQVSGANKKAHSARDARGGLHGWRQTGWAD